MLVSNRMTTVPLPLSLHLAAYTVIGLFCAFAFLAVTGASWGYVFGIYMGRKEVVTLGFVLSAGYLAFGVWQATVNPFLGLLLLAIGAYGGGALLYYRRQILEI